MGAPEGNNNYKTGKRMESAVLRALARAGGNVDGGLDTGADELVKAYHKGERWAVEFVRDTLDGKPKQQTEISGPGGSAVPLSVTVNLVERKP